MNRVPVTGLPTPRHYRLKNAPAVVTARVSCSGFRVSPWRPDPSLDRVIGAAAAGGSWTPRPRSELLPHSRLGRRVARGVRGDASSRIVISSSDPAGLGYGQDLPPSFQNLFAGPFPIRRVYLDTPAGRKPRPCSEDDALPCRAGWEDAVASALAARLEARGMGRAVFSMRSARRPRRTRCFTCAPRHSGDAPLTFPAISSISVVRGAPEGYMGGCLAQHARSRPGADGAGWSASDADQEVSRPAAGALLTELARSSASTPPPGTPGASPGLRSGLFHDFHERLIQRVAPPGSFQLLRVSSAEATLGVSKLAYAGGVVSLSERLRSTGTAARAGSSPTPARSSTALPRDCTLRFPRGRRPVQEVPFHRLAVHELARSSEAGRQLETLNQLRQLRHALHGPRPPRLICVRPPRAAVRTAARSRPQHQRQQLGSGRTGSKRSKTSIDITSSPRRVSTTRQESDRNRTRPSR